VDIFPWVIQSLAVVGNATPRASAAGCTSCRPQHGLSMASASGHAVPGDTPSLGSTSVRSLVIG
jgi:hypothetical protein